MDTGIKIKTRNQKRKISRNKVETVKKQQRLFRTTTKKMQILVFL